MNQNHRVEKTVLQRSDQGRAVIRCASESNRDVITCVQRVDEAGKTVKQKNCARIDAIKPQAERIHVEIVVAMLRSVGTRNSQTPWWYRYVRSWRLRMWIETGAWVEERLG